MFSDDLCNTLEDIDVKGRGWFRPAYGKWIYYYVSKYYFFKREKKNNMNAM